MVPKQISSTRSFRLSPALVPLRKGSLLIRCSKGFDPNPKPKPKKQKAPPELVKKDSEGEMTTTTSREIPSYLANRMLGRIAIFSGVPVLIGICILPVFYYFKVVQDIDIPSWVVYASQFLTFGGGIFGISYAILSSNPGNQDDFLGLENFKSNIKNITKK